MATAGAPTLLNPQAPGGGSLLKADSPQISMQSVNSQKWGIFKKDNITPVLSADSIISIEYNREFHVATYPMEQGAFQSYNKTKEPYRVPIRVVKSGNQSILSAFLEEVEALVSDTNLYDIITPSLTYTNANIVRYSYKRTAQSGVSMLTVDLEIEEIRSDVTTTYSQTNVQNKASADSSNIGLVQPSSYTNPYVSSSVQ